MDRKDLVRQGMQAATNLRDQLELDPFGPADPYAAAARLGVTVRFIDSSMEGFYFKQGPGRILLSSLRPVPRRAFTCAHELGHHCFGHGSTIDQLQEDERPDSSKPDEILVNAFAAFFLMPSVGLRGAFARRGWSPTTASPPSDLHRRLPVRRRLRHLDQPSELHAPGDQRGSTDELDRWTPQRIRLQLLGDDYDSFVVVDGQNEATNFDVEKGAAVLLPLGVDVDGEAIEHVRSSRRVRPLPRGDGVASPP